MKLLRLTVDKFKNLNNLQIEFDTDFDTFVMLGGNGTGKSNLIEALVAIFADVDLRRAPAFTYQLEYECRRQTVIISGKLGNPVPIVSVSEESVDLPKENERTPDYMPDNIVAYALSHLGMTTASGEEVNALQRMSRDLIQLR